VPQHYIAISGRRTEMLMVLKRCLSGCGITGTGVYANARGRAIHKGICGAAPFPVLKANVELWRQRKMNYLTDQIRCPRCETSFPVEFHRMRVNTPYGCPSCGFQCTISEDQAIRAHRLLERIECQKRTVGPVSRLRVSESEGKWFDSLQKA
jgi:hypothetical protein